VAHGKARRSRASEETVPQQSCGTRRLGFQPNIYLHYVLDLWFSHRVRPQCRGEACYFRFADDFVAGFQYRQEAEQFRAALGERLKRFKLRLAEEKTRCLAFGRFARHNAQTRGTKPEEFTFLGFAHYCGKSKRGHFKVKRRTSRKKLGAGLRAFSHWARRARHKQTKAEMLTRAKVRLQGHLTDYAITDNARSCSRYVYHATRILRRWLNRKSQRKAYSWDQYNDVLRHVQWPRVQIRIDLNPFRSAEAC
jgi:RNA-directed DNA polymerase